MVDIINALCEYVIFVGLVILTTALVVYFLFPDSED